jgi:hypothetical protein
VDGVLTIRINDQAGNCYDQRGWLDIRIRVDERQTASKRPRSKRRRQVIVVEKRRVTETIVVSGKRRR